MYCSLAKALKTTLLTAELYDQEYYSHDTLPGCSATS